MDSTTFVGHLDAIENGEAYGWALNRSNPDQPVIVQVYLDGVLAAEVLAGYYRPDVAAALNCSGRNGFYVDLEALCEVAGSVLVDVRYPDQVAIEGGPFVYRAPGKQHAPKQPALLYLHIPKTAGTAFREMMLPNFKQSQVLYIYGDPPGFPMASLRDVPIGQRARFRMVCGHFGYGIHCDMPIECQYAAVIRDPLQRIWSHYTHLVRDNDPAAVEGGAVKSIQQVMEERQSVHLDNLYVRYLCGLEESVLPPGSIDRETFEQALANARRSDVFIGHQQNLSLMYDQLAQDRGWIRGLQSPRLNLSPQPGLAPNNAQIQAMKNFNAWDLKLYAAITGSGLQVTAASC